MTLKINLLDHGFVQFIESWGSDERIIESARMSTYKGFEGWGPMQCECVPDGSALPLVQVADASCKKCKGTGIRDGDEKLLKYLYEHKHMTPFEMGGIVVEVQAPIFVFREWHRHRTQCLAGDTRITLVTPSGTTSHRTIQQIYQLKHGGVIDAEPSRHRNGRLKSGGQAWRDARRCDPWRTRILPNCQTRVMRTLDEESGQYRIGRMADVWQSGEKELWEVRTSMGTVRASLKHPFKTPHGWAELSQLSVNELIASSGRVALRDRPIPPALRSGIGVWTSMMRTRLIRPVDNCHLCGNQFVFDDLELDHVVPVTENIALALDERNLKPACVDCHRRKINTEQPNRVGQSGLGLRWARVLGVPQRVGEEMTYDIAMDGPDHNYMANGLVVHNSYNELSARYTPLPNVNYMPTIERLMINAGKSNRQAGTVDDAETLTESNAVIFQQMLAENYARDEVLYQDALRNGVPKELARLMIPVGRYSRMRAQANLRNWLGFLTLRMDKAAQYEIRMYANAVGDLISELFPRTWELFNAK